MAEIGRSLSERTGRWDVLLGNATQEMEADSRLQRELEEQVSNQIDIPLVIGSQRVISPAQVAVTAPHDHARQLGKVSQATANQARQAIEAAVKAQADWSRWSLQERAAVFLKAADLLSGPWRQRLNAVRSDVWRRYTIAPSTQCPVVPHDLGHVPQILRLTINPSDQL